MRRIILFNLALITLLSVYVKCDLEQVYKLCDKEVPVSEADIKKFNASGMKAADATENVKCHAKCVMEKIGYLKSNLFSADAATKYLKDQATLKNRTNDIEKVVAECGKEKGNNPCDQGFNIAMCFEKNQMYV